MVSFFTAYPLGQSEVEERPGGADGLPLASLHPETAISM
jgi:hypothetical protein